MIRRTTLNLNYANKGKLENLYKIAEEYKRVVNIFIDRLWYDQQFNGLFVENTQVDSWLSARLKQAASKQALAIVKSQRKRKNKSKPILKRLIMDIDSRFIEISQDINSFDIWVKFASIGDKIILVLPSRKHTHFNKLKNSGCELKKSTRIRINNKGVFIDVFFEKEAPKLREMGESKAIDIGYKNLIVSSDSEFIGDASIYEKISRKQQGSNAFKRALIERDELINIACKSLELENVQCLYAEDLKSVKKNSKGKIRKSFNNKLQRWAYPKVLEKLSMICEELGIYFEKINPFKTSQRCSECGVICKSNRKGETYKCACGLVINSDLNAAYNILHIGAYGLDTL